MLSIAPPATLTTKELEDALFEVIVNCSLDASDPRFLEIDDFFAGAEGHEDEIECRYALCRLLSQLSVQ